VDETVGRDNVGDAEVRSQKSRAMVKSHTLILVIASHTPWRRLLQIDTYRRHADLHHEIIDTTTARPIGARTGFVERLLCH